MPLRHNNLFLSLKQNIFVCRSQFSPEIQKRSLSKAETQMSLMDFLNDEWVLLSFFVLTDKKKVELNVSEPILIWNMLNLQLWHVILNDSSKNNNLLYIITFFISPSKVLTVKNLAIVWLFPFACTYKLIL